MTASKDTRARAQIVAKYLYRYNRTDVPIGIGLKTPGGIGSLYPWASDLDLDTYRASGGIVHDDGIAALVDMLMSSAEPITILAIGPQTNLGAIAWHYPTVAQKIRVVYSTFGALDRCYGGAPIAVPGSCVEFNVAQDVQAAQRVLGAPWAMRITPLDTCSISMSGDPWHRMQIASNSGHFIVSTLLESLNSWGNGAYPPGCVGSDIIYDAVSMYMTQTTALFKMQVVPLNITENGALVRDPAGKLLNVALSWVEGGRRQFQETLADMLIAAKPSDRIHFTTLDSLPKMHARFSSLGSDNRASIFAAVLPHSWQSSIVCSLIFLGLALGIAGIVFRVRRRYSQRGMCIAVAAGALGHSQYVPGCRESPLPVFVE